jgi:flagellar motor component MotA
MLAAMNDPESIGPAVLVALLCPFYSLLTSEGLLRPMARHLEHRLESTDQ